MPTSTTSPPASDIGDDSDHDIQRISSEVSSGSPLDHTMDRIGMGESLVTPRITQRILISEILGSYQRALLGLCGLGKPLSLCRPERSNRFAFDRLGRR